MEQQLEQLVREQGFEAVFQSLKTIVTREHERAKRDFDFLQRLVKPEAKPEEETKPVEEPVANETKTIQVPRKLIRKKKEVD
jgi:hypothetical protein